MNVPSGIKQQLNVAVPDELHRKLKAEAARRSTTLVNVALEAFELWIVKDEIKDAPPEINPEIFRAIARLLLHPKDETDEQLIKFMQVLLRKDYGLDSSVAFPSKNDT